MRIGTGRHTAAGTRRLIAAVLLAAVLTAALAGCGGLNGSGATASFTDVSYGSAEAEVLDVMFTDDGVPKPLLLCVHGGSYTSGSRGDMSEALRMYAAEGLTVATIDYTLGPEATIAEQVRCVLDAAAYLCKNAQKYQIDTARVVFMGVSSGAHLAARAAESAADGTGAGYKLAGLIDMAGPASLAYMLENVSSSLAAYLLAHPEAFDGNADGDVYTELAKVDVLENVTDRLPSVLIIHGDADTTVPIEVSVLLRDALTALGVPVEFNAVEGMQHTFDVSVVDPFVRAYLHALGLIEA